MKRQIRKLGLLVRFGIIDTKDFYVITVYNDEIKLQGRYKTEIISKFKKWNFVLDDISKYIKATRKGITITLTD